MINSKVLIVEDEFIIAKDIKKVILELNFEVTDIVYKPNDIFNSIKTNQPDIILMDIGLKGKLSGIDIVKKLYKDLYIPVIYLTAYINDDTINEAIKTNPIAYLIKPFNRFELKSMVLLGLHKSKLLKDKELLNLGDNFYFDQNNKKLYNEKNIIKLGEKETKLLDFLILSKGRVVFFNEIIDEIWNDEIDNVSQDAVRIMIYRLRNKLYPQLIQSVPYQGFKIEIRA